MQGDPRTPVQLYPDFIQPKLEEVFIITNPTLEIRTPVPLICPASGCIRPIDLEDDLSLADNYWILQVRRSRIAANCR